MSFYRSISDLTCCDVVCDSCYIGDSDLERVTNEMCNDMSIRKCGAVNTNIESLALVLSRLTRYVAGINGMIWSHWFNQILSIMQQSSVWMFYDVVSPVRNKNQSNFVDDVAASQPAIKCCNQFYNLPRNFFRGLLLKSRNYWTETDTVTSRILAVTTLCLVNMFFTDELARVCCRLHERSAVCELLRAAYGRFA